MKGTKKPFLSDGTSCRILESYFGIVMKIPNPRGLMAQFGPFRWVFGVPSKVPKMNKFLDKSFITKLFSNKPINIHDALKTSLLVILCG